MNKSRRKNKVTESRPKGGEKEKGNTITGSLDEPNSAMYALPACRYISSGNGPISGLTSGTGKIGAEPAARVFVRRTACEMDGTTKVLQAPGLPIRVSSVQSVSGVERGAHATVVQYYVASLHAFSSPAGHQVLIKAFKLKAAFTVAQYLTSDPATPLGPCLLSGHRNVIHHVVDGAEEWRNLAEDTVMWQF